MKRALLVMLALVFLAAAEEPREKQRANVPQVDEAVRAELIGFQGHWTVTSIEEEGQALSKDKYRRRTVFFGGSQFVVRQGEQIIQTGIHKVDPKASPKTIDAAIVSGMNKGEKMLGIYEFKGDTLKVCFDTEGRERPTEFKTKPDSTLHLAVYKRIKSADEEAIDIVGRYLCDGTELDGSSYNCVVEIQRQGDAYLVRWLRSGSDAHVGTGIRKGNQLSVAWLSRGGAGICVYTIEKGPRLSGEWTEVGGIGAIRGELLTPIKSDK